MIPAVGNDPAGKLIGNCINAFDRMIDDQCAVIGDKTGKTMEGIDPGSDGVQVIVFGDPNSRRCVRFAQKITLE